MFVKAWNLVLFSSVFGEPAVEVDDPYLLQTKIQKSSSEPLLPGADCFTEFEDVWGPGWHCGLQEVEKWCGSNDWNYGQVVRKCCPGVCPAKKKGGCDFDKTQCDAAGCPSGTACCLKKGTAEIKSKFNGKDITRENRQKCYKNGNVWCSQGNKKYCGTDGFEKPDDSKCKCAVGEDSDQTPEEVMATINAAKAEKEKDTKKESTLKESTIKKESVDNEARKKRKEAFRKEWKTKNPKSVRRKWQEANEKKTPTTAAPSPPPATTTEAPEVTPSPVAPKPTPSPPSDGKDYDTCKAAGCKKGKGFSCCVYGKGKKAKMMKTYTGKDITQKNRDNCLKKDKKNNWCTQGNFVYDRKKAGF